MAKKEKVKLNKFEKWFRSLHRFEKYVFRRIYWYKKCGHIQTYDDRPYIFVGNHLSYADVFLMAVATNKPVHFIAKKQLFEKGLMKKFVTKCQCIPVSRDGTDVKAIMQAMKYLKGGESVAIFPEGTRNKTKEIFLPFKSGAAAISVKTKTPIVPIVQFKKLKPFRRRKVFYGEPIEFIDYYDKRLTEEDIKKCDEILLDKMLKMHAELAKIKKKGRKK